MIPKRRVAAFLSQLVPWIEEDEYFMSDTSSTYYDTPTLTLAVAAMSKPLYKEKLRVRTYDPEPTASSQAFIEIKKKFNKETFKRRLASTVEEINHYFKTGKLDIVSPIRREIDMFIARYPNLSPITTIDYHRHSYRDRLHHGVRLTFDEDICCYLKDRDKSYRLLNEDVVLLEIKVPNSMALWLARALSEQGCFPVSFSKYAYGITTLLKEQSGNDQFTFQ